MKKKVIIIFGVLVVLAIAWMGYVSVKELNRKKAIEHAQNDLSQLLNQLGQSVDHIAPLTILVFFNSGCEHCQWEMQEINKHIDQFAKHQLLLVSFEPEQKAATFLNQYGLSDFYLKSTPERVMAAFTGGVPQTLIYRNGRLKKHFKGEVKIEAITDVLRQ
ncbi:MAG: redoxin domain-containing protein [Ekhidna sp.]|nr:redoxin domain-containing protein [Ekhidna sp.]